MINHIIMTYKLVLYGTTMPQERKNVANNTASGCSRYLTYVSSFLCRHNVVTNNISITS